MLINMTKLETSTINKATKLLNCKNFFSLYKQVNFVLKRMLNNISMWNVKFLII